VGEGVLAYERRSGDESYVVAINLTGQVVELTGADAGTADTADTAGLHGRTVALSSDGNDEGRAFSGSLRGDQAVVLAAAAPPVPD